MDSFLRVKACRDDVWRTSRLVVVLVSAMLNVLRVRTLRRLAEFPTSCIHQIHKPDMRST